MNFKEIRNIVNHLIKTSKCKDCKKTFKQEDINILATTKTEGLFEIKCPKCNTITIINVILNSNKPEEDDVNIKYSPYNRTHRKISYNEVLDIKNFLNNFDGNFKKIFTKKS